MDGFVPRSVDESHEKRGFIDDERQHGRLGLKVVDLMRLRFHVVVIQPARRTQPGDLQFVVLVAFDPVQFLSQKILHSSLSLRH